VTNIAAADLPNGSVVADDASAWFKVQPNGWQVTGHGPAADDRHIDWQIQRGAQVLRAGDGR
jgi:hypothetical protein